MNNIDTDNAKKRKVVSKKTEQVVAVKSSEKPSFEAKVYDITGNQVETIALSPEIFGLKVSPKLIAQYIRVYLANQKPIQAIVKTRGEVSGSTKKIYRQKGTGNARHGARKAPIFVGGGVAHGPRGADRSLKIGKKQKKLALFGALSNRYNNSDIFFIKGLSEIEPKTKSMAQLLKKLGLNTQTSLLLTFIKNDSRNAYLASRNIGNITVCDALSLNPFEILKAKKLIFSIEGLESFTKHHVN